MLRLGVLVSGGGTNLQAIIDEIENGNLKDVEIVTICSNKKNVFALERGKKYGIETKVISPRDYSLREDFDIALRDYFVSKNVDLIVMAGYLVVVGKPLIDAYKNKIMNIHPSLIPAFCGDGYYGLKVHQAALNKGVKVTGATVHFVDYGTDTGPIIIQKAVYIKDGDTAEILQKRVMEQAEWVILPEAIKLFSKDKIKVNGSIVSVGGDE